MEVKMYSLELIKGIPALVSEKSYACDELLDVPDKVADLCISLRLDKQAEEHVMMIALSACMSPIGIFELSHGTINVSLANPRGAFLRALLCGAYQIVIIHNHPSGSLQPSDEDFLTCQRLVDLGKSLEIQVADFLIVSGEGYKSFRNEFNDRFCF